MGFPREMDEYVGREFNFGILMLIFSGKEWGMEKILKK
jgi:hypothetical protein